MNPFLIQFIGGIGYTLLGLSYFKQKKSNILFMQIIAYVMFTIHYYLLNGTTGAICNLIGLFSLIIIYIFERYNLKHKNIMVFITIILLIIINLFTFQNIYSIFPMVASVVVIFSFLIDDEELIRKVGIIAAVCWLIYAIVYKSYIAIVFEVLTLISVCVAFFKNHNK